MNARYLGKIGVIIAASVLLSLLSWSGLQSQTVKSPIARGPFYIALAIKKVAVLPFADHSHRESFAQALNWGGNERVAEKIRSYLAAKELIVSGQNKVNKLLVAKGMINLMKGADRPLSFSWSLINEPHNPLMSELLMKRLISSHEATDPLLKEEVIEMGKRLMVDTIVRGRISERKKVRLSEVFEKPKDPLVGVVPFRLSEIGPNAIGYAIFEGYEAELPPVDTTRAVRLRKTSSPTVETSIIKIDIYLQNAETGEVEWSNQLELECPVEYDGKAIDADLSKGIKLLMDDFFSNYLFYYRGDWLCIKKRS